MTIDSDEASGKNSVSMTWVLLTWFKRRLKAIRLKAVRYGFLVPTSRNDAISFIILPGDTGQP